MSRLQFTENILPTLDLSNLLEYAVDPIRVWYRDGETPVYSLQLGRKEAFHAYRAGLTLYFHLNDSVSGDLISELSRQLERPTSMFHVSIFASRRGGETMPHVDGNENFTVHLQGKKRWRISPGEEYPEIRKFQGLSPAMNRQSRQPDVWDQVEPLEMTPGSFLYCPSYFWHTVETIEDSLSLNVSISEIYTWADALLPAIRAALMSKPEWQSPRVGLWSTGNQRKLANNIVRQLLNRLSEDLRDINSDDFLAAWGAAEVKPLSQVDFPVAFVRNPLVSCHIVRVVPNREFRLLIESTVRPGKKYTLTLDWKYYIPFLTLVNDRNVRQAKHFEDVPELLSQLLLYGVLRPSPFNSESE